MNKNEFIKIALVWMLSRWRQFFDRDTISLRDFVRWKRAKMKNGWERGLMTQDRPTHDHKRKRLLRASDENHFPTEIQIFMLSIRSSWNYYRPITTLSLSLSWWECIENEFILDEVQSKITKKLDILLYTFCKSSNSLCCVIIIVIGNCV